MDAHFLVCVLQFLREFNFLSFENIFGAAAAAGD